MSDNQERWSMAGRNIDRDKLRAAIRKMGTEYVFLMLDDAITLLPQRKLRKLIAQHLAGVYCECSPETLRIPSKSFRP